VSPVAHHWRKVEREAFVLTQGDLRTLALYEQDRPRVRSDCSPGGVNGERPCPWASCRHHLAFDLSQSGNVREVAGWDEGGASCSLDVAEQGGVTLEEVGALLGLTRERVRQVEVKALFHVRRAAAKERP
jgi:hypothetical protein